MAPSRTARVQTLVALFGIGLAFVFSAQRRMTLIHNIVLMMTASARVFKGTSVLFMYDFPFFLRRLIGDVHFIFGNMQRIV